MCPDRVEKLQPAPPDLVEPVLGDQPEGSGPQHLDPHLGRTSSGAQRREHLLDQLGGRGGIARQGPLHLPLGGDTIFTHAAASVAHAPEYEAGRVMYSMVARWRSLTA